MLGIWPMAFIVTVIGFAAFIWLFASEGHRLRRKGYSPFYLLVSLLIALPLSPLVNLYVKRPLAMWLTTLPDPLGQAMVQGSRSLLGFVTRLFLAPVTEEAVKLLPLAIPLVRRPMFSSEDMGSRVTSLGLSIGVGFGVGEALFLAWVIAMVPSTRTVPFYAFSGYFGERLIASFAHGVMTSFALYGLYQVKKSALAGLWGYLGAICLHAALNLGAALYQEGIMPIQFAGIPLTVDLILLIWVFENLRTREIKMERKLGLQSNLETGSDGVESVLWERKEGQGKRGKEVKRGKELGQVEQGVQRAQQEQRAQGEQEVLEAQGAQVEKKEQRVQEKQGVQEKQRTREAQAELGEQIKNAEPAEKGETDNAPK